MSKHSSHILELTRQRAASRLRELLDEIRMLMVSFPDLRDAFDADALPIAFILERDSRRLEPDVRTQDISTSDDATSVRIKTAGGEHRHGPRKQPSDD